MVAAKHGQKRIVMSETAIDVAHMPRRCAKFFLDSGAHTLYTVHVINVNHANGYSWYKDVEFWEFVDRYAAFLKEYKSGIDFYANLDVIFNPKLTYKVQKYLEDEHGLKPVPVVHYNTDLSWVDRYIEDGHTYIGIGGLGQEVTKQMYYGWADALYAHLGKGNGGVPRVKTHGFAMTSYELMTRYPWYSVDSVSWAKHAGLGGIYVPHYRNGKFDFSVKPYAITIDLVRKRHVPNDGKHIKSMTRAEFNLVLNWLDEIDVPYGRVWEKDGVMQKAYGVTSEYNARALANARFYERLCQALPKWPWSFNIKPRSGFFQRKGIK